MTVHLSKKILEKAAAAAVNAPAPVNGNPYLEEARIGNSYKSELKRKPYFNAERRASKILGAIGLAGAVVTPAFMGWTNLSLAISVTGLVTFVIGAYQGFFRPYPIAVTQDTINEAKQQLEEAGEDGQSTPSVIGEVFMAALCIADGFLTGSAVSERLGQSILTPRMAMLVGALFGISLTAALFALLKAAARESRMADARKAIRELELNDKAKADAMKQRLGGVLNHSYSPRDDQIKMRATLCALVVFMAVASFGLRLSAFSEADSRMQESREQMQRS